MPNKRPIATLAVLGAIIVIVLIVGQYLGLVSGFMRRLVNPIASGAYQLTQAIYPKSKDHATLDEQRAQIAKLQEENQVLSTENAQLKTLEDENNRFREFFEISQSQKRPMQVAEIIARGRPEDSWRNRELITLNQGTDQGLRVGLPIVSSTGALIGKITSVKNNVSEACLLYSPDCRLAVALAGKGATLGISRGNLGLTVLIEFIAQNTVLAENDMIVSSGLEDGMPSGILIGKVSRIITEGNELWKSAVLEPTADFDSIRFVGVLK